jgi:Fe-S cluster biogenesis protein NfuA
MTVAAVDVMERIRPYISSHRGTVEIVDFDPMDGVLVVRLGGTCQGCSAATVTLRQGIESRVRAAVPEVRIIESV